MAQHLPFGHGEADAGFDLALRHRLDAGADDLGRIGAEIDRHGEERGGRFGRASRRGRQAEEDEKQLHDERRVADQFDIGDDDAAEPVGPKVRAEAPAVPTAMPATVDTTVSTMREDQPVAAARRQYGSSAAKCR